MTPGHVVERGAVVGQVSVGHPDVGRGSAMPAIGDGRDLRGVQLVAGVHQSGSRAVRGARVVGRAVVQVGPNRAVESAGVGRAGAQVQAPVVVVVVVGGGDPAGGGHRRSDVGINALIVDQVAVDRDGPVAVVVAVVDIVGGPAVIAVVAAEGQSGVYHRGSRHRVLKDLIY